MGTPKGTSPPVILNESCDKKHEYIYFMSCYLNIF